jgi:hypothetical protein
MSSTTQEGQDKFTFGRDELLDIQLDFLEILKSPEAIDKEWTNLDGFAGNGIVSLAELELWLCVRFPILRHATAIRMTFYKILQLSKSQNGFIQKQAMHHLLVVIFCSNQALRWWNELPSKSADKVVAWLASKKVETCDERMALENSRQQLAPNMILQNLQSRIGAAVQSNTMFCMEFDFFCDLMASFKTTQIDILYCNLTICPMEPLDFSVKPRMFSDIQRKIRAEIVRATRAQDHLSASILPYMKGRGSQNRSYSSRPSTCSSQFRPFTAQSAISNNPNVAKHLQLSRDSLTRLDARPMTPMETRSLASELERPRTSSDSVLSMLTGRSGMSGSIEECDSAGEVVPGILFTKNAELAKTRLSYFKTFGLQHPHTGSYFHSPQHNDLLSEKQLAESGSASLPNYAARLTESPLKKPTFQLLRNKPGSNPLAFSTDRLPSKHGKDINQAMYPRRPWSNEFSSSPNINGSFSLSSAEVQMAKNTSPVTRALSPASAKLLSPAASPIARTLVSLRSRDASSVSKSASQATPDWDSSASPLGFFEKTSKSRSFAKTEWA